MTTTTSSLYGGKGGVSDYKFSCPSGEHVTAFYGASSSHLNSLGIRCSDKSTFGPTGGTGGLGKDISCDTGFPTTMVYADTYVDAINPTCRLFGETQYKFGNSTGTKNDFSCPSGSVITGIAGKSGDYVDSIQFTCGAPKLDPSSASPTTSSTPSSSTTTKNSSNTTMYIVIGVTVLVLLVGIGAIVAGSSKKKTIV